MLAFFTIEEASKSADYWFSESGFTWDKETPTYTKIKAQYHDLKQDAKKPNCFAGTGRLGVHRKPFFGLSIYIYMHEV